MNSMFERKNPAQLAAQLAAMQSKGSEKDPKEWTAETDTNGNGTFIIRFLPGINAESLPFVHKVTHFFQGTGKTYYSEACTSTHGDFKSCPVCAYIRENNLYENDKELYGKMKRSHSYWSNILVIKDPNRPENEGKIFKYRFGQKIMDKINSELNVDTDMGEVAVDVTCLRGGKNFMLKIKKVGKHNNYEDSKFQGISEVPNIDDPTFQQFLVAEMSDIQKLVAPEVFKSKEENEKTLKEVLGAVAGGAAASAAHKQAANMANELDAFQAEMAQFDSAPATQQPEASDVKLSTPASTTGGSVDDIMKELNLDGL